MHIRILVSLCLTLTATTAFSQNTPPIPINPPPGKPAAADEPVPPRPQDEVLQKLDVLNSDEARGELKISDEQRRKVQELIDSARKDIDKLYSKLPSQTQTEIVLAAAKLQALAVVEEYRRKIDDILTPEQRQQLRQLYFRLRGMKAVVDADIAPQLKLTDDQKQRIEVAIKELPARRREVIRLTSAKTKPGRDERRELLRRLPLELDAFITSLLTPDQLAAFDRIRNAPAVGAVPSQPAEDPSLPKASLGKPAPAPPVEKK